MNRKLFLAAISALLLLGACADFTTAPQPDEHPARDEQADSTRNDGGGSMGSGN